MKLQVPESAVSVTCHSSEEHQISSDILNVSSQTPAPPMTKQMPSPKQVHYMKSPGHFMPSHPTLQWQQYPPPARLWRAHPCPSCIAIPPQFAADDLLTLQNADSSLRTMAAHMSNPLEHSISSADLTTSSELRTLHSVKHVLHLQDRVLTYAPEPLTAPKLVVPHGQRGIMLTHTRCTMMCCQFQPANPNHRQEKGEDQTH